MTPHSGKPSPEAFLLPQQSLRWTHTTIAGSELCVRSHRIPRAGLGVEMKETGAGISCNYFWPPATIASSWWLSPQVLASSFPSRFPPVGILPAGTKGEIFGILWSTHALVSSIFWATVSVKITGLLTEGSPKEGGKLSDFFSCRDPCVRSVSKTSQESGFSFQSLVF